MDAVIDRNAVPQWSLLGMSRKRSETLSPQPDTQQLPQWSLLGMSRKRRCGQPGLLHPGHPAAMEPARDEQEEQDPEEKLAAH